ncbi:MAG TPA: AzlC family ABC transporter permease [Actinomycetota bacterium]|nr:AzlC family ABC transporter permease [Actinomycetota bacterium]
MTGASRRRPERSSYVLGARASLPVVASDVAFGASLGVLAGSAEVPALAAVALSALAFSGSAQFAALSVVAAGGSVVAATLSAASLNSRYAVMGLTVAPAFEGGVIRRFLLAQLLVDESWAIGWTTEGVFDVRRMIGAGVVLWVSWVSATAIGVAVSGAAGDPEALGLDALSPALFLALLVRRPWTRRQASLSVGAASVCLALVPVLPVGLPLLFASLLAFVAGPRASAGTEAEKEPH